MRHLLTGLVVAVAATLVPSFVLAGNQEIAAQIAQNMKASGQLENYKIRVKFQDGTAWLQGQVTSKAQMNSALKLAFQTPGVTRVVNYMAVVDPTATAKPVQVAAKAPKATTLRIGSTKAPRPVRVARGAFAPESRGRNMPLSQATTPRIASAPAQKANQAELVPAEFTPSPARLTAAAQPIPTARPAATPMPQRPLPVAYMQQAQAMPAAQPGGPIPAYVGGAGQASPARYDQPYMPNHAWPSYAAYPNYAALTYPKQYSPTAWPYIGPFYPYPQVPLGWRKVVLEWDDGWWMLDFKSKKHR